MGKKRKCRLTDSELLIHEKAVKLRKKTDKQLIQALQDEFNRGFTTGQKTKQTLDYLKLETIGITTTDSEGRQLQPEEIIIALYESCETLNSILIKLKNEKSTPADGELFASTEAKNIFLQLLQETPGIGKATISKIKDLIY